MRLRSAAAGAAVAALLAIAVAGPAVAVQTDEFGLRVGDSSANALVVAAGSGTVDHSVLVTNRTRGPLTVELAAVDVQRSAEGVFSYGSPGVGLARAVHLGQQSVTLRPLASVLVPVTISTPSSVRTATYAAVVGVADTARSDQLTIRPRLAVLVEVTAGHGAAAGAVASLGFPLAVVLIAVGVVGLIGAAITTAFRRRRAARAPLDAPPARGSASVPVSEPVLVHAAAAVVDAAPLAVLPAARIAVPDEERPAASSVERLRAAPLAVLPVERIAPPDEERPIVSSVDRLRGRR